MAQKPPPKYLGVRRVDPGVEAQASRVPGSCRIAVRLSAPIGCKPHLQEVELLLLLAAISYQKQYALPNRLVAEHVQAQDLEYRAVDGELMLMVFFRPVSSQPLTRLPL